MINTKPHCVDLESLSAQRDSQITTDPFLAVFNRIQQDLVDIHERNGDSLGTSLPLRRRHTYGYCTESVARAIHIFNQEFGIPRQSLVPNPLTDLVQQFHNAPTEKGSDTRPIAPPHTFLYIIDAHRFRDSAPPHDIYFDATSSQFSGQKPIFGLSRHLAAESDHELVNLYGSLTASGPEGRAMVRELFLTGHLVIPHNERGEERLRLLVTNFTYPDRRDQLALPEELRQFFRKEIVPCAIDIDYAVENTFAFWPSIGGPRWPRPLQQSLERPNGRELYASEFAERVNHVLRELREIPMRPTNQSLHQGISPTTWLSPFYEVPATPFSFRAEVVQQERTTQCILAFFHRELCFCEYPALSLCYTPHGLHSVKDMDGVRLPYAIHDSDAVVSLGRAALAQSITKFVDHGGPPAGPSLSQALAAFRQTSPLVP